MQAQVRAGAHVCRECGHLFPSDEPSPRDRSSPRDTAARRERAQWRPPRASTLAVVSILGLLLVAGAYALGDRLGDNSDAVRTAHVKGRKAGFDAGRERAYRTSYAAAKRRAKRAAEEAQDVSGPSTGALQTARTVGEPTSTGAPSGSELSGDEGGERVPCWYGGGGMCTPEQNAQEGEAERVCGPGGAEAKARPDLCGPVE